MNPPSSTNVELPPGGDSRNPTSEVDVVELRTGATPSGEGIKEPPGVAGVEVGSGGDEEAPGGGAREEDTAAATGTGGDGDGATTVTGGGDGGDGDGARFLDGGRLRPITRSSYNSPNIPDVDIHSGVRDALSSMGPAPMVDAQSRRIRLGDTIRRSVLVHSDILAIDYGSILVGSTADDDYIMEDGDERGVHERAHVDQDDRGGSVDQDEKVPMDEDASTPPNWEESLDLFVQTEEQMADDPPASHSSLVPTTTDIGHSSTVPTISHDAPPPPPPTIESGAPHSAVPESGVPESGLPESSIPATVDSQSAVPEAREPWMRGGPRNKALPPSFGMYIAKAIYELTPMDRGVHY